MPANSHNDVKSTLCGNRSAAPCSSGYSDSVAVIARPAPFLDQRVVCEFPAGGSVADMLAALGFPRDIPARIFLSQQSNTDDSSFVHDDARDRIFPQPGQILTVRAVPQAGNKALGAVLEVLVVAAAAAATIATAGALTPVLGATLAGVGGTIAGAGTALVGSLIARALVPPPTPKGPRLSTDPASFTISGRQNLLAPFSPIPRVYGTRLVSPMMAAAPYTQRIGNDQYLRQLFVVGYGPLDITQLKIRDTLLDDFEDVRWQVFAGYPDDPPPTMYTGQVIEDDINVLLAQAPNDQVQLTGWQKQTTGTDCDEISIDVTFPNGLLTIGKSNGTHVWAQVAIQIRYAPTGTTSWTYRPSIVVNAATASLVLHGDQWQVPRGQYDVEVQATNVQVYKGDFTNPFVIDCYWTAIRTIRHRPPVAMSGLAMVALTIRASHQLNGVIDQLNCVAASILPDYNAATGIWDDRAGSWFYDYDNQGAGALSYGLDSVTPHTATAITGRNFIASETLGVGDGSTVTFAHTLAGVPVQPASFQGNTGTIPFIDDGLGNVHADGSQVAQWSSATGYPKGQVARWNGNVYVSLQGANTNHQPDSSPSWWALCISSSTINYATGACSITFGLAAASGAQITASYAQQVVSGPPAGKALIITTAGPDDGAAVAGKSMVVHQDPPDHFTGGRTGRQFVVSGWYKASRAISNGIRLRVVFGTTEDFPVSQAVSSVDVVANAAATTSWQQASATVTSPTSIVGEGSNFFMRVVVYHNPDGVGGVQVEWDDIQVTLVEKGITAINEIPNPSFDSPGRITSNPASHYRDVLLGPANKQPLTASRLDLPALQAWWQDCSANSRNNNMICDQQKTVFDALRDISAIGRASFGMRDGLYSIVRDQPQSVPIQHFTPRNSWGFKSTRSFPQLPGALKVRFINPAADWKQDEQIVYDDGFTPSNTTVYEAMDLTHGVTDHAQAWRDGRYHLAQARLRPETYELSVDVENLVCQRGDLVLVSHDVPNWGLGAGRIKSVTLDGNGNAIGIATDETFTFAPSTSYVVRVRRSADGSSLLIGLTNPSTGQADVATNEMTFTAPIASNAQQPSIGDLVMFGQNGLETVQCLVTRIRPGPDLSATLEMSDYSQPIYSADSGPPPAFAGARAYTPIPAPLIASARSDDLAMTKAADGSATPRITIAIDDSALTMFSQPPQTASGPVPRIAGVRVEYRRSAAANGTTNGSAAWSRSQAYVVGDTVSYNGYIWLCSEANTNQTPGTLDSNGNPYWTVLTTGAQPKTPSWTQMPIQTPARLIHVEPVEPRVTYDVRTRYEMTDGSVTPWTYLSSHTVAGQVTLPADVSYVTSLMLGLSRVLLQWPAGAFPNTREYEVRQGSSFATATFVARTRATQLRIETLLPGTYTYWVAVVDTSGNYSPSPPSTTVSITAGGPVIEVFDRLVGDPAADVSNTTSETTLYQKTVHGSAMGSDGALIVEWIGDYLSNGGSPSSLAINFYYGGTRIAQYADAGDPTNTSRYPMSGRLVVSANKLVAVTCAAVATKGAAIGNSGGGGTDALHVQESNCDGVAVQESAPIQMTVQHGVASASIDFRLLSLQITYLPP